MNDELNASIELIQRITGATAQTVQRWKNNTSTPPESASRLLRFHVLGDVSALLGQSWEGFYFRDGLLLSGNGAAGLSRLKSGRFFGRCSRSPDCSGRIASSSKSWNGEAQKSTPWRSRQIFIGGRWHSKAGLE